MVYFVIQKIFQIRKVLKWKGKTCLIDRHIKIYIIFTFKLYKYTFT